jgi:hypothetical protein
MSSPGGVFLVLLLSTGIFQSCCANDILPPSSADSVQPRSITKGPLNFATYAGPAVKLTCSANIDDRVQWIEYATSPVGGSIVSDGSVLLPSHPNFNRSLLEANEETGSYNLTITQTIVNDGGRYECKDALTGTSLSADLIIIASPPNCSTTVPENGVIIENVYYTMECTQYFKAREGIAPIMTWTGPPANFSQLYTRNNDSIFSGVSFFASKPMEAKSFTMRVDFTQDDFGGPGMANNVPTWSDSFTSQLLTVHYGPQDLYYSPDQPSYDVGQVITCNAISNPLSTYRWIDLMTFTEYESRTIELTANMVGQLLLRCEVTNTISSANIFVNSTVKPITTTMPRTTPTTTTPAPPVSTCRDLTGRWEHVRSETSKAILCLYVDRTQNAYVSGLLWNDTETEAYFMEIMGRTRNNVFDETGFIGIWPLEVGVTAFAAECSRCYGDETLIVNPLSRSSRDNEYCADGGRLYEGSPYHFKRVPPAYPCSSGATWVDMRETSRVAAAERRLKLQQQRLRWPEEAGI